MLEKTVIDQGRTDRNSPPTIVMPTQTQKFKFNGQSVPKMEWKQTDKRTEAIALPPTLMRSVKMQLR